MIVTGCNRQGICCVISQGTAGKIVYLIYHIAYLLLGGVAITHHSFLDLPGAVFTDGDIALCQGQENNTPGMAKGENTPDMFVKKHAFHCRIIRLVFI